jgi:glycosyltransferase involved in cell wall biosynthesis
MELSVVIITRNEEAVIGACIESVLKHTEGLEREIILVDSASTDRTVEIAKGYPVTIVRIDACSGYSPAAGRYVGTSHARGRLVLFLDGDNVLIEGWVEDAMARFKTEGVAAIAGRIYRVNPGEDLNLKHPDKLVPGESLYLPTAGMYQREVLEQVGTFNPFVRGEEERELGFRIRRAGYSIRQDDVPMIYHVYKERTKSELDEKAGYFTGIGQIFRRYGKQSINRDLLAKHWSFFAEVLLVLFMVCCSIVFLLSGLHLPFVATVGIMSVLILLLVARKGWKKVYLFFRAEFLKTRNIVRGFRRGISDAGDFRATVSEMSRVPRPDGGRSLSLT